MARYSFIAAAVALSVLLALGVTLRSFVAPAGNPGMTGHAKERVAAGHAIVGDYLKMTAEARLDADRAADAELAESRKLAAAAAAATRTASAPKTAKPARVAATPLPEPVPAPAPPVGAPPLPLQPPQTATEQAPTKPPVISRVVSTVGRIPGWVSSSVVNAASWVIDLPSQAVTQLPERRFL
jgi:hypothetical protein